MSATAPAQHSKACCGKPCCKGGSCCAKPTDSNSVPQPVLPTQTASQTDWQLAAAIAQHLITVASTGDRSAIRPQIFVSVSPAVPLYQRHCSFLI
jgi:hypothetical protein